MFNISIKHPQQELRIISAPYGVYLIGRDSSCRVILDDGSVEDAHAVLTLMEDESYVEDLMSAGVFVDGEPVGTRLQVFPGVPIQIGNYTLEFNHKDEPVDPGAATVANVFKPNVIPRAVSRTQAVKQQIHTELVNRLDLKRLSMNKLQESELQTKIRNTLDEIIHEIRDRLPADIESARLAKEIFDEAVGLGPLEDLLEDESITEIMVNGPSQVYVERGGKLEPTDCSFINDASVNSIIERIVSPIGRRIDESQPYVDARLADGSRVNAIIHPLSLIGPCITIRKFSKDPFSVDDLIGFGTLSRDVADFLQTCVLLRKNILVSGGTGSGKTTLLNVLSSYLPNDERILTIEDAAELRLSQEHIVRLEARPANIEGRGAVSIRDLVRNALRMRPDRIVVGECRGAEALDMLQAMNTGHEGSLTTIHANSPRDTLARLETMVLMAGMDLPIRAIREQVGSAVHMICQISRFSDGTRKVSKITEVSGLEQDRITLQDIFEFRQTGVDHSGKVEGALVPTGAVPTFVEDIGIRGIQFDRSIFTNGAMGLIMFWLVPSLFACCAGLFVYALLTSLRSAEKTYADQFSAQTALQFEDLFLFISPELILRITHLAALLIFMISFALAGSFHTLGGLIRGGIAGLLGAGIIYLIPRFLIKLLRRRRLERFNTQLAPALDAMSNALKAGFSIQQAFSSVVDEGEAPIAQEFSMFLQQLRIGVSFEDALTEMEKRMGSEDLTLMVQSVGIARQTGGNLTEVFDRISETIRERRKIEGKIKSLTAQGRIQGRVVSAMPLLLGAGMYLIDAQMMKAFIQSTAGMVMLLMVVLLEILGTVFINKIVNIDV